MKSPSESGSPATPGVPAPRPAPPKHYPREAALFYAPDGYEVEGRNVMGRHVAGSTFLEALVRHRTGPLFCFTSNKKHFENYRKQVEAFAKGGKVDTGWIPREEHSMLPRLGSLFIPGPSIGEFAWKRALRGDARYSICGVFHTTATLRVMDAMGDVLIAPTQEWDAIVCTSRAVRDSIGTLLEGFREYYAERLGRKPAIRPQLPVIALGVHASQFEADRAKRLARRAEVRRKLDIPENAMVVLFVGRLSHTAKVHPTPMYLAVEEAARRSGKSVYLVQCGWFSHEKFEKQYQEDAARFCPSVKAVFVDGRQNYWKENVWYGADIFCSLSDNVQETFGITPIEAMAANLPVVVSDWDGYRDTVRDGVDGFRIPTFQPPAGAGRHFMVEHALGRASYSLYVGLACQVAAVDIRSTADAFVRLMMDPGLRQRMGAAGRGRVVRHFDWKVILEQYRELWSELTARRRLAQGTPAGRRGGDPARMDPFRFFECYPTEVLREGTLVRLGPTRARHAVGPMWSSPLVDFARSILEPAEKCEKILDFVKDRGEASISEIGQAFDGIESTRLMWAIAALLKYGYLEAVDLPRPR